MIPRLCALLLEVSSSLRLGTDMMEDWSLCFSLLLSLLVQEVHRHICELAKTLELSVIDHLSKRGRRLGDG